MQEKRTYPCGPAVTEEIIGAMQRAGLGFRGEITKLRQITHQIDASEIPWSSVRHMGVIGDVRDHCNFSLEKFGFHSGIYTNHDGDWLLLIHPEDGPIQEYADRCADTLVSLIIVNRKLSVLDLSRLAKLTTLNLSECGTLKELPPLDSLTQLTTLNLSRCRSLTTLPPLDSLTQLTTLNLSECGSLTHLPPLDNLTQLTTLDLSRCRSLMQLPPLNGLTQLEKLDLTCCSDLTILPPLEDLTQLRTLDLTWCSGLAQLPLLDGLTQLTALVLYECSGLTELNLSGCSSLTELNFSSCTNLSVLNISGCCNLSQLTVLERTPLTELSISHCQSLTRLNLSEHSELTELNLSECCNLTWLNLSGCSSLRELPAGLRAIKSLRGLNLRYMKLRDLPDWLPEIAECFSRDYSYQYGTNKAAVSLYRTKVENIPDMSIFEQPYEVVREWFEKRSRGDTHPLNEIKVVFLGDGEAGKSHTIARLMNDGGEPIDYTDQSTPGIVIRNKEYDLGDRRITVHYWDFGGQEIMHSMHRIFLTGRTMYVILLNARDDTQSDRAKYWLHNVKSFAPDAPVLLVLNKIDQNENASVDERDLRGRYDKLTQVVKLSAKEFTQKKFNDCFTKVLLGEIQKTGFLDAQWPDSWSAVKKRLENMTSHYITGDRYEEICHECRVDENQENLLRWFNDLGVSFCCTGERHSSLRDYVILRPDWITNALYIILFNRLEGANNGLIPHDSIFDILRDAHRDPTIRCTLPTARYNGNDIGYVLGIMRKFNLSFTDGHENEFIPMLCQQNSMVDIQSYQKDAEILEFNMEFDYLPNNLLHRLMVERCAELDMKMVWRTGARFRQKELGYSAVVVIDSNTLRFFIRHTDPMHRPNTYLTMLKAHVERIVHHMGLKAPTCQLIYKLEDGRCAEFGYDRLLKLRKRGRREEYCEKLDEDFQIEDILNQSAPDGLEDEQKLLDAIRRSCRHIQEEPEYYLKDGESGWGKEDQRNRRIRADLELLGYTIFDQTQRGLSGTGRGIGELDLLLYNDRKEPWTIIEALRVSNGSKTEWNKHLNKLLANYNYFGAPCVYLLTYVDADEADFQRIWDGYQLHIPGIDPGKFTYCANSLTVLEAADSPRYVKTAKCRYVCGDQATTAYHIFVQVPMHGESIL